MALTLSIPIRSKAAVGYNAFAEFTKTYNDATYGFSPVTLTDLPSGYVFDPDVINYVIERAGKGFNYKIGNESGIVVRDWIYDQTSSLANWIFGTVVNAYIATASFVQDYVYTGAEAYRWYYTFTGADESYPGWDTYGTAYGFRFEGICGDKIDLVLDSEGNFYGLNPLGNIIMDQQTDPYEYIRIHQGNNDPTDPEIYAPSASYNYFDDLPQPYFEGKDLHFFLVDGENNNQVHETIVHNCENTYIISDKYYGNHGQIPQIYFFKHKYSNDQVNDLSLTSDIFTNPIFGSSTLQFSSNIIEPNVSSGNFFSMRLNNNTSYPFHYGSNLPSGSIIGGSGSSYVVNSVSYAGWKYNNYWAPNWVSGSNYMYLRSFSYTPNSNPQEIPENPVPITEIPENPEDPLPSSDPDPVPGINYPVNPTPPPLRPVPSIVSGNDDLWPSVIELQNIEIDLSGYLSSLGDFEFPDLNTITESFAGSIVWVSALMSTLFNGSDFSILFAVLSSFFIVAALLGLYKWWNHK